MYCKNCGALIKENDLFCGVCGTPSNQADAENRASGNDNGKNGAFNPYSGQFEENSNNGTANPKPPIRKVPTTVSSQPAPRSNINLNINKSTLRKIIIFSLVGIVLIVGVTAGLFLYSDYKLKSPIEIDLNDYMSEKYVTNQEIEQASEEGGYSEESETYTYTNFPYGAALPVQGYNEYGYVDETTLSNVVDWERLYQDINESLSKKKGYENYSLSDFMNDGEFTFRINKKDKIKNGDKIAVEASTTKKDFKIQDVTISFSPGLKTYTVDSLKTVNAFDPFDYVTLYSKGANHYGYVYLEIDDSLSKKIKGVDNMKVEKYSDNTISVFSGDVIVAKVTFYFSSESNTENLTNGDVVLVYCECEQQQSLIDDYSLYIAKNEMKYKIVNMGSYIDRNFDIPNSNLKVFRRDAYARILDDLGSSEYYSDVNFSSAYLADLKDSTDSYSETKNVLYLVYSYKYTDSWTNETTKKYCCVEYRNLIGKDGKILNGVSDYYSNYYFGDSEAELVTNNSYSDTYNFRKIK